MQVVVASASFLAFSAGIIPLCADTVSDDESDNAGSSASASSNTSTGDVNNNSAYAHGGDGGVTLGGQSIVDGGSAAATAATGTGYLNASNSPDGADTFQAANGTGGSATAIAPELLGDTNIDGRVDLSDLNIVLNLLETADAGYTWGGFDGATTIDLTDLNDVLNNLGTRTTLNSSDALNQSTTPTPEPASLFILGIALLALQRRGTRNAQLPYRSPPAPHLKSQNSARHQAPSSPFLRAKNIFAANGLIFSISVAVLRRQ